jgi:hypothetical protein
MASSGPNNPGTMTEGALNDWSAVYSGGVGSYNNAKASDDAHAASYGSTGGSTRTTSYLTATNFGFAIPAGSTIDGIVVEIERRYDFNVGTGKDNTVVIVKGGSYGSTNKADTVTTWPAADAYASYGGAADKWGETWLVSDINASNFGVGLKADIYQAGKAVMVVLVDHIRVTVYYTEGATGGAAKITCAAMTGIGR